MNKIKEILGKIIIFPLIFLIIPVVILFIPYIIISELINGKQQKARFNNFCKEATGIFFLVCSKRHNWYDFIQNNVIPVLPSNLNIVWYEGNCDLEVDNIRISAKEVPGVYGATKPLLLTVLPDRINVESLNNDFNELRPINMCKDENIREKARILIEEKLRNNKI